MPQVILATSEQNRQYGKLPRYRLTNGFIEADPNNGVDGKQWLQRPGLVQRQAITPAVGAIRMVYQQDGVFSGDIIILAGDTLYKLRDTGDIYNIGTIATNDFPVVAGEGEKALIVSGGNVYSTNGGTTTQLNIPDDQEIDSVDYINGYFILTVKDSLRFYWIVPGGTDPDPLDYASAERSSDFIVTVKVQGDTIWFLKQTNEEVWVTTGSADAPFQRITGRVSKFGCASRNTAVLIGTLLGWVTADRQIVVADGSPQVISSPSDTEKLRAADPEQMRAWAYTLDGHTFYVLTTDQQTIACDLSAGGQIAVYSSLNKAIWRAHLGCQKGKDIIGGDALTSILWTVDPEASDDAGTPFVREVTGFIGNVGEPVSCDSLSLNVDAGWSPTPGFEPLLEVCFSDDQGNIWSSWKQKSLGDQGHYGKDLTFRSLGLVVRPGRLFWFRMSDAARYRLSYVRMNEV